MLKKSFVNMSRISFSTWGKMTGGESINNHDEDDEAFEELER